MKVSLKWLSEYTQVPGDLKAFCDRLDLTGTGVEGKERIGASFDKVVTAQVLKREKHPDSDHLWVCSVDVGEFNLGQDGKPEPLQIVCGAQNFNEGDHIVTALVGATLPGDVQIKKSKLRGVVSCGMNCSARELGMGSDHAGIMILPQDAPVGVPFADYAGLADTVLDLEITPNRPDSLSVAGFAREVAAMYRQPWTNPVHAMADSLELADNGVPVDEAVTVQIEDAQRCPRYSARVIRGCKVGPSPDWMVERLGAIGQRSINNIVDATNYILFLLGQPLHAFDLAKLTGADGKAHIVVRAAAEGETLTTLDGEKRQLTPDMTVISTPEHGAVALAGVMGGLASEVTEDTVDVLLETATFEAGRTSRCSRNLGLISESSMRYERGVDDHDIELRSAAAAALIAQVSGGTVASSTDGSGIVDAWPLVSEQPHLTFRIPRFQAFIGSSIPRDFIVDALTRLGCEVADGPEPDELSVISPTFRPDLPREVDLYEEVLRLYGMDLIEPTLPGSPQRVGVRTEAQRTMDKIHDTLRACGVNETMTYSFADPHELEQLRMPAQGLGQAVELINPLNAEQSVMRQSIIPGLLRSVAYNQARGVHNVQLYETGVVFFGHEGHAKPKERQRLACVMAGAMGDAAWNAAPAPFDFFDGKGVVEALIRELAIPKAHFKELSAEEAPHLQPGRAAQVLSGGTTLGWLGEIHPLACEAFDAAAPVVAFELDLDALVRCARPARDYVHVPEFPPVTMDVAFVVDEDVTHERLEHAIKGAGGKLLDTVRLFDVYRDALRVGVGKKSMAYALEYRAADRTLTTEEVDKQHARLVKKVCAATGAEVRG